MVKKRSLLRRAEWKAATKTGGAVVALTVAVSASGAVVSPEPASAHHPYTTQGSTALFHTLGPVKGVPLYRGYLRQTITGDLLNVKTLRYDLAAPKLCGWWVDWDIYSFIDGRHIYHNQGARQGCFYGGRVGVRPVALGLSPGDQVCATLWQQSAGTISRVVRTCHFLTAP